MLVLVRHLQVAGFLVCPGYGGPMTDKAMSLAVSILSYICPKLLSSQQPPLDPLRLSHLAASVDIFWSLSLFWKWLC